jgi:flagella basal body P-ring formation protein FlgA
MFDSASQVNNMMGLNPRRGGLLNYILRAIINNPKNAIFGCVAVFVVTALPSHAAISLSFLDSCVVNDTAIKLGDVARINADCSDSLLNQINQMPVGESAPAGYSRYVNSNDMLLFAMRVRFPKLTLTASPNKRILVKTAYQEKTIGEYSDYIVKYLLEKIGWPEGTCTILINNRDEKWKCLPRPIAVKVEGLASKFPRGNFNLKLIGLQGSRHYSTNVSCFTKVVLPVLVAKMDIARGTILSAENCSVESRDITHCNYSPLSTLKEIENTKSSRNITLGSLIHERLLSKIPVIERDDQVMVIVIHGRVKICMSARAREAGSVGEKIWVENEMTHKLLKTKVIDHGNVVLLTGEGTI